MAIKSKHVYVLQVLPSKPVSLFNSLLHREWLDLLGREASKISAAQRDRNI